MGRDKQVLLILGGCYLLGFIGIFISTVMERWDIGPAIYVFGEAFGRAIIWPYEILKLVM